MDLKLTITELANITNKTRPTIYKYIMCYEDNNLDEIPYSFIRLFDLMKDKGKTKKDILDYCKKNFVEVDNNPKIEKIIKLIREYETKLNLDELSKYIEGEIEKNGIKGTK